VDLPVALHELVQGASIEVPTPSGPVTLKIPPRSRNGQKLRLRSKGVPASAGSPAGDLYATLELELPEADERLAELARGAEPLYRGRDLRAHLKD
jgi:DnaJ-class molecular chaperone